MRKVNNTINKFLFISFICEFSRTFFHGIYTLFLINNNLSDSEVNLIKIFFMITIVVTDIPTGAISDKIGRIKTFILGCFTCSIAFFIYYLSSHIILFIISEIVYGFGLALISGSLDAWIVDKIKNEYADYSLEKLFSKGNIVGIAGMLLGGNLGILLSTNNFRIPWIVASIGMLLTGLITIIVLQNDIKIEKVENSSHDNKSIYGNIRNSIKILLGNKNIMLVALMGSIFSIFNQPIFQFWQPLFKYDLNLDIKYFTILYSVMYISSILGNFYIMKLEQSKILNLTSYIVLGLAIPIILMFFISNVYIDIVLIGISQFFRGMFTPIIGLLSNIFIENSYRATILSIISVANRLGSIISLLITGYIAQNISRITSWIIVSIIFLLLIPINKLIRYKSSILVEN